MSQPTSTNDKPQEKRNDMTRSPGDMTRMSADATRSPFEKTEAKPSEAKRSEAKPSEAKPSETKHSDASGAVGAQVRDKLERGVAASGELVGELKEQASNLTQDVRSAAAGAYDHAAEIVEDVTERARELGSDAAHYAANAGSATARFVSRHALPLSLITAGLGWLAWSMRRGSRPTVPVRRRMAASPTPRLEYDDTVGSRPVDTTSSKKLMGVRTGRTGYES
ncbi:MAG TPA: hypothetical protein VI299_21895 [Polyangiales bacterium]